MTEEEWRPIHGYEGFYEVSDTGRVKSLEREIVTKNGVRRPIRGQMMTPSGNGSGYLHVRLSKEANPLTLYVHRLVLLAFVGQPPPGHECCHKDSNRGNNRLGNLRWDTHTGNMTDMILRGRHRRGIKLTADNVIDIRLRLSHGQTQHEIAAEFGVTQVTISGIKLGLIWAWLDSPCPALTG